MRQNVCIEMIKPHEAIIIFLVGYLLGVTNMPRGAPDYNNQNYSVARADVDFSSLLLALKGANSIDGLGRIMFFETFDRGLGAWDKFVSGTGTAPKLSVSNVEIAPVSVVLEASNGAAVGVSGIRRGFNTTQAGRYGVQTSFYNTGGDFYIEIVLIGRSDTRYYEATLRISMLNSTVEIRTPSGYVQVVELPTDLGLLMYAQVKLVADFETGKYARLIIGQDIIPLTQDIYTPSASVGENSVIVQIDANDNNHSGDQLYIGHVILTADEP